MYFGMYIAKKKITKGNLCMTKMYRMLNFLNLIQLIVSVLVDSYNIKVYNLIFLQQMFVSSTIMILV